MSALGVLVGLAISEAIFRARDRAAFPHLNIYLSDPELGVRLASSRKNTCEATTSSRAPTIQARGASRVDEDAAAWIDVSFSDSEPRWGSPRG